MQDDKEEEKDGSDPNLLNWDDVETFFNSIGISPDHTEMLYENGFDNFESLSYLSAEILENIGIDDSKVWKTILESLSSIAAAYWECGDMKQALS